MWQYFFISLGVLVIVWVAAIVYCQIKETSWDEKNPRERDLNPYIYDKGFYQSIWLIVATMVLIPGGIIVHSERTDFEKEETQEIVAASSSITTQGKIFLFGGTIESRPSYFYFVQNEDGGINQQYVHASNTTIYEGYEEPVLVRIQKCKSSYSWLAAETCADPRSQYNPPRYEFRVPNRSVSTDINFAPGG